ncbi:hypothetical protein FKM82_021947 [Ascaphus truei]
MAEGRRSLTRLSQGSSASKGPAGSASVSNFQVVGPGLSHAVTLILSSTPQRKGSSLPAIKKALSASGYNLGKNNGRLKLVMKKMLQRGTILQSRGSGFSGSFKLKSKPQRKAKSMKTRQSSKSTIKGRVKGGKKNVKKPSKKNKKADRNSKTPTATKNQTPNPTKLGFPTQVLKNPTQANF